MADAFEEQRLPRSITTVALVIWLVAGAVAFLPFARDTSPWNAVTLRVPGNQWNWWHALIGAPFFLAFPMIWLRVRSLSSGEPSTRTERRVIGVAAVLSALGTIAVEVPFLLHRAGTSEAQRLAIVGTGLGVLAITSALLFAGRRQIPPTQACLVGLDAAYLANVALCLIVYAEATGPVASRLGWLVTMVIVWPIVLEWFWLLSKPLGPQDARGTSLAS